MLPFYLRRRKRLFPFSAVATLTASASLSGALFCDAPPAFAQGVVGNLKITRQVQVSRGPLTSGVTPQFVPARNNQGVVSGQAIRTLKRSLAEITFRDKSVLRINERTDLVLQDSAALRSVQLSSGVVWVRVAKGTATQVETPSATAVARGTDFVVRVLPEGGTQLTVLSGRVDMIVTNQTVSVGAGETITAADGPNGGVVLPGAPSGIPAGDLPEELGGSLPGWWNAFSLDSGLSVTPGSNFAFGLRSSPLTEIIQQSAVDNKGFRPQGNQSVNPNTGTGLNVSVDTRSAFRGDTITDFTNYQFRLLDRNDTSLTLLGVGAAVSLFGNAASGSGFKVSVPQAEAGVWGFASDPSFAGARGRIGGTVGATRYRAESNVIRLLSGDNTRTSGKLDSVAVVEHVVGDSVVIFAGRDRFFSGPVFQNQFLSQLIADRYSSAGATLRRGGVTLQAAYLYDSNPDVGGAQGGALATVSYKIGGGIVGLNGLRTATVRDGYGATASFSLPVVRNTLDFYGEVGQAPDSSTLQTYGTYFPGLFQKTDIDLFLEYGSHEGIGHGVSLIASKDLNKNINVRGYGTAEGNRSRVGAAAIFRVGTK